MERQNAFLQILRSVEVLAKVAIPPSKRIELVSKTVDCILLDIS